GTLGWARAEMFNKVKKPLIAGMLLLGRLAETALAVTLERGTIAVLTDRDGRLAGGGETGRDGAVEFELLRHPSGELRSSVPYRDGTVLLYDATVAERGRLLIETAEGNQTLHELARAQRIDLDHERESELDDDIICIVPPAARSDAWPYGED